MGLIRFVPKRPHPQYPNFLYEVDFTAFAEKVAALEVTQLATAAPTTMSLNPMALNRIVATERLDDLRLVLASSGENSAWVNGPKGIGTTTLVEALLRERAMGRLSNALATTPMFLFDPYAFYAESGNLVDRFSKVLETITARRGLLIMDHFDDFVKTAPSGDARLLVNLLVSHLEAFNGLQAIVISESDSRDDIVRTSTGIRRRFQEIQLRQEPKPEELTPYLLAHFGRLESVHGVNFTPEDADEIIRLLTRYPGRAFAGPRPRNAIAFAEAVAAYVRINAYAEPRDIKAMRERLGILRDEHRVLLSDGPDAQARVTAVEAEIAPLEAAYKNADLAWRASSKPLLEARAQYEDVNTRHQVLAQKVGRSPAEEGLFSGLDKALPLALKQVEDAEKALYPTPPTVSIDDIREVFSRESHIALSTLGADVDERLDGLKAYLDDQIFNQNRAKEILIRAYTERELGVQDPSRPAVIMFTGGTGLGKTELINVLARFDAGETAEPLALNMSEFTAEQDVGKLKGAAPGLVGFDAGSPIMNAIADNERAILLIDEIDKAHPAVIDALMQMLDKGETTLSNGRKVDLKRLLIVINTNAVTAHGLEAEGLAPEQLRDSAVIRAKLIEARDRNGRQLFRPELVGRLGEVVVFDTLGPSEARMILAKEVRGINRDYQGRGIELIMNDDVADGIVAAYYDPAMGGRSLRSIAQTHIRGILTPYIMEHRRELTSKPDVIARVELGFDGTTTSLQKVDEVSRPRSRRAASGASIAVAGAGQRL